MDKKYLPIIGLEVHIEPILKSKMFCSCPADHFGKKPNTQTCPVCLGLPGALPFINKAGIEAVIKLGLVLGSKVNNFSKFYRKHYFYPDLPKGFQTSQLDDPFCVGGTLMDKKINHIHLEEDAGKLVHQGNYSLIDFNRSGVALIELVTEPDFHDTESVIFFLKEIQLIARYLEISNADMEKGSMRLEANISLSSQLSVTNFQLPNYKVELKNINSFRFLEKAINAEIKRQTEALDKGEKLIQETRGYDEIKQTTFSQRTKADSHDYRYFPEPDLPPIRMTNDKLQMLNAKLPELPQKKRERFEKKYKLPKDYIEILVSDLSRSNYFEACIKLAPEAIKQIADLMVNQKLDSQFLEPAGLVRKVVELTKVKYSSQEEVESAINLVIMDNEKAVSDYKNGNGNVIGFLIGMVQKRLEGKGNIQIVREKLLERLQK